ncbi:hypothetical protein FPRO06_01759 [Fusarium proliferatum]|nr:hypothetical protein FPRO06_01759 [Fusarium proliferatum]
MMSINSLKGVQDPRLCSELVFLKSDHCVSALWEETQGYRHHHLQPKQRQGDEAGYDHEFNDNTQRAQQHDCANSEVTADNELLPLSLTLLTATS